MFSRKTLLGLSLLSFVLSAYIFQQAVIRFAAAKTHTATSPSTAESLSAVKRRARISQYDGLPLQFEIRPDGYLARGNGYSMLISGTDAILKLKVHAKETSTKNSIGETAAIIRMSLLGAQIPQRITGQDEAANKSNYFVGNDPSKWRRNVANFARVKIGQVYPGIDLVWYGNQRLLEHDFIVAPGADAGLIGMAFSGIDKIRLDRQGNLKLMLRDGELELRKPAAWQNINGERREVDCAFQVGKNGRVSFRLGHYDIRRELVIDPVLAYSSLIGGTNSDQGLDIAVDSQGAAYVTGRTFSTDFPVVNPLQPNSAKPDTEEVFVTKINPAGTAIVYSTYLGGDGFDEGSSIAVDGSGNVYLGGRTSSTNFPVTNGAPQKSNAGLVDGFVAKLNPAGSTLVYSTLIGGNLADQVNSLAVDADGNVYVAGQSDSSDFASLNLANIRQGSALYRSVNGGAAWTGYANAMPAVRINVLTADPTNPAVLYAGGRWGIYKSTDGGINWTQTASYEVAVSSIVIDPANANIVYALLENGGVVKSVNAGADFNAPFNPPAEAFGIFALAFDPKQPGTIYLGDFGGMFKSVNNGANWQMINNGLTQPGFPDPPRIRQIAIDPNQTSTLYIATTRNVFKSTDGGASWAAANAGLGGAFADVRNIKIDTSNPTVLYAYLLNGVYKSVNGAESWTAINNGLIPAGQAIPLRINALAIDPANSSNLYAGTNGSGVYKTIDGGANWSPVNNGLNNQSVFAVWADPANSQRVLAGTDAGSDVFAGKLNATGSQWSYFRVIGGFESDSAVAIAVDGQGAAYLTGTTVSLNFPVLNAVQPALAGNTDAFVIKLNQTGQTQYATYLGGELADQPAGIGLDQTGTVVVAGTTMSRNFPLVAPFRATPATGIGGAVVNDGFVTKLNPQGTAWSYSTYFGSTGGSTISAMTVAPNGEIYLAGLSLAQSFPVVAPIQPVPLNDRGGFISQFNAAGSALLFSSFFGLGVNNPIASMALDGAGNLYLTAGGDASRFPTLNPIPLPGTNRGTDALVAKIGAQTADLAITMIDRPDPVQVNGNLSYELTVINNGPNAATDVTVTNVLPDGVNLVSVNTSQGNCSGERTIVCALGNLALRASAVVSLQVTPTAAVQLINRASVTSAIADGNASNNTAEQETRVSTLPSIFGRVTASDGQGISGVTLSLSPQFRATTSDDKGYYQFGELAAGANYTVSPSKAGLAFNPVNRQFNNLSSDQRADFTAARCTFTITPANASFSAIGGAGSFTVMASNDACAWTSRSTVPWIRLTAGSNSTGSGAVIFTVEPATAPRRASIIIAGQVIPVRQEFNACAQVEFQRLPVTVLEQTQNPIVVFAAADFNKDRISDIVIRSSPTEVLVRFGNGAGGFSAQTSIAVPATAVTSAGTDYNRDGNPDFGILDTSAGTLTILLNDGTGSFNATAPLNLGGNFRLLSFGDFNGDGVEDLLFSNVNGVRLLGSAGNGGFTEIPASLPVDPNGVFFDRGDFNGDGNLDLLEFIPPPPLGGPSKIQVLFGDGQGSFTDSVVQSLTGLKPAISIADYNNDGKADLALTTAEPQPSGHGIVVAFSKGDGRFGTSDGLINPNVFINSPEILTLLADDINGDGIFDFRATTRFTDQLLLFSGQSDGQFQPLATVAINTENSTPRAGDFNGDGAIDLLMTTLTNNATLLLNRGTCAPAGYLTLTSAASFNRLRMASDSIAAAFGANLANEVAVAQSTPLPTALAGTSLRIRDSAGRELDAPLFFVSPGQINLLVPGGMANGPALVTVRRGSAILATGVIEIVTVNPGLLSADATGKGYAAAVVLRVKSDGTQVFEPVTQYNAAQNRFDPVPIDVGNQAERVFVVLFGTGLRNRSSLMNVSARIGGEAAETLYAGDQGGFAGLDQLNVRLAPVLAGKGDVDVILTVDGKVANTVRLRIK